MRLFCDACSRNHGDREPQLSVSIENPLGTEHGQSDDSLSAWRKAQDMALRRLLSLSLPRCADMQVEDIVVSVVVRVIKDDRPDSDLHFPHRPGTFSTLSRYRRLTGVA